jgi:hypothetical protein
LVIDQLKSSFKNNKTIILTAIEVIGVDALWDKEIEIYQDVEIMVAALKSPYGQICWEPLLTAVGSLSLIANIVLFTLFINSRKDKTAIGIFSMTVMYGLIILYAKFFL